MTVPWVRRRGTDVGQMDRTWGLCEEDVRYKHGMVFLIHREMVRAVINAGGQFATLYLVNCDRCRHEFMTWKTYDTEGPSASAGSLS